MVTRNGEAFQVAAFAFWCCGPSGSVGRLDVVGNIIKGAQTKAAFHFVSQPIDGANKGHGVDLLWLTFLVPKDFFTGFMYAPWEDRLKPGRPQFDNHLLIAGNVGIASLACAYRLSGF